jgi:hypothetical protein
MLAAWVSWDLLPLDKNFQGALPLADESITYPATETAAVGNQMQGFQVAGLANAIVAHQQVDSGSRRPLPLLKTAELSKDDTLDLHRENSTTARTRGPTLPLQHSEVFHRSSAQRRKAFQRTGKA